METRVTWLTSRSKSVAEPRRLAPKLVPALSGHAIAVAAPGTELS